MKIQVLLFDDANSIVHTDVIIPKANITASRDLAGGRRLYPGDSFN